LPVAIGRSTLRFETAAIAALAIGRAALDRMQ
jgi:16S rRNA U1498 N3-methylase RsmE